jgi:CheY-like chemotaxis protein
MGSLNQTFTQEKGRGVSIKRRAVIVTDDRSQQQTVKSLREALNKIGLTQTVCTTSLVEISNIVMASQWPIVFVDHVPEQFDGLREFERIYRSAGNQLFHYYLLLPTDEKALERASKSLGFAGVVHKPVQPAEVNSAVSPALDSGLDSVLKSAHEFCIGMIKKDYTFCDNKLKLIKQNAKFKIKAEIARAYLLDVNNESSKIMTLFGRLVKDEFVDLRTLSEYIYFLRKFSIYDECANIFSKIRAKQPNLTGKTWEEICFLSEIEKYDEIATLLEQMSADEKSRSDIEASFARLLYCFCLEGKVKEFLGPKHVELAAFELLTQREQQKERERQERAAAAAAQALKLA